jgi:hypothetical protein
LVSSLHTLASSILVTQPIRSIWESVIRSIHHVLLQVLHFKANVTLAITVHTTQSKILGGEYPLVHIGSPVSLGMSSRGITQPLYVCNTPIVSIAPDGHFLRETEHNPPRAQHEPSLRLRQARVRLRLVRLLAGGAAETRPRLFRRL